MIRIFSLPLGITALLWASSASGRAATLDYNYGVFEVNFLTGANVNQAIQGFDPTLGALTAIDISYAASAVLFVGDALSTDIQIYDGANLLAKINFPNDMVGRDEQTVSGSFSVPAADWTNFETAGTVDLTFSPSTACRAAGDGCQGFTANVTDNVTYTYTPSDPMPASTPEPGTLALLGAGLTVLGVASAQRIRPVQDE
jgi:PEP-CTERM motif